MSFFLCGQCVNLNKLHVNATRVENLFVFIINCLFVLFVLFISILELNKSLKSAKMK